MSFDVGLYEVDSPFLWNYISSTIQRLYSYAQAQLCLPHTVLHHRSSQVWCNVKCQKCSKYSIHLNTHTRTHTHTQIYMYVHVKNDWHTLLTGFMGVRPEPVWSLWRSSYRPGDLSLRTSIILPGERSIRGSAMARPGERSNRGSAMALPGDPPIRLSSILPGDFSLSRGRLGDLSLRNSVRASR